MAKILIAEDDKDLASTTQAWLIGHGHAVDVAPSGSQALERLDAFGYDAVILDWGLPEVSGLEILRRFRSRGGMTPVLMLTGKKALEEKELALDEGADDYLTKPFEPRELTARLKALLRRPPQLIGKQITYKNYVLEPALLKVSVDGKDVPLQPIECAVIEYMMKHPTAILAPDTILRNVWESDCDVSLGAIYTCIKKLRKKLDRDGQPSLIRTVHGVGYTLEG